MRIRKHRAAVASVFLLASAVQAGDVTFSGFLSAGGGKISDDTASAYAGYSEEDLVFDVNSLLGLQVVGTVSDKVSITGQFVARGSSDFEMEAEWAYLTYAVNDNFKWRIGRLRTPFYMFSDYVDVGYAYNWIQAPSEVYYLPFNNVEGMDFLYNFSAGSFDGLVQGYVGAFSGEFSLFGVEVSADSRNQMGISFQLNRDWLSFRTAYHSADLSVDVNQLNTLSAGVAAFCGGLAAANAVFADFSDCGVIDGEKFLANEDPASFLNVALSIDTGRFIAVLESVKFDIEDSPFSEDIRNYVMVGVRFGDFVLHATLAKSEDEDKTSKMLAGLPESVGTSFTPSAGALYIVQEQLRCGRDPANPSNPAGIDPNCAGGLDALRAGISGLTSDLTDVHDTTSIGLRWDFTSSTALKLQVDDVDYDDQDSQRVFRFAIQSVF